MLEFLLGYLIFCVIANHLLFHVILIFPRPHPRPYKVLKQSDVILGNHTSFTAEYLCNSYKPIIRQSVSLRGPQPYDMWCEVIDPENNPFIDIFYRVRWLNENHPNRFLDIIYQIFRTFYFGSRQDLEFILLRIDRTTERISSIKFETDRSLDPDHSSPEHVVAQLTVNANVPSKYDCVVAGVKSDPITLSFIDNHPIIEVLTWNHVFMAGYLSSTFNEYDIPVTFLTEKQYKRYRFDRRSWVDYGVKINKKLPLRNAGWFTAICLIGSIILGFIFLL